MFMCMDNVYGFSNAKYEVIFEKKRGNFNKSYELRVVVVDKNFTLKYILFFVRIFLTKNTLFVMFFFSPVSIIIFTHITITFLRNVPNCYDMIIIRIVHVSTSALFFSIYLSIPLSYLYLS